MYYMFLKPIKLLSRKLIIINLSSTKIKVQQKLKY